MTAIVLIYMGDYLRRLVVDRGELRLDAQRKSIHLGGDDLEFVVQQSDQRQEDFIGDAQSGNQQQRLRFFFSKNLEVHGNG